MARISIRKLIQIKQTIRTSTKNRIFLSHSSSLSSLQNNPSSIYRPFVKRFDFYQNTSHLFQLQAQLITSGVYPVWSDKFLKMFSDVGQINYVVLIFKHIDLPDTFCVNNVIKAYSLSSTPNQAVVFYFEMMKNGFLPNSYTFVSLFSACAKMGCVENAKLCHGQAVKNGVECVVPVQNSLIHLYSSCGTMEFVKKVFDGMCVRDLVTWNSMVDACANAGDLGFARRLFDAMIERNVVSWNVMITSYLKGNNPGAALMVFRRMVRSGLRGNEKTVVSVITACGRSARGREGQSVHGFMIKSSLNFGVIVGTCLIDMYCKCRRVDVARRIFDRMVNKNLVCWNAMILGHCIHGKPEDGLSLFAEMVRGEALSPDEVTYIGILCACARAGLLTEGRKFFSQMKCRYSIKRNFAHYWCMANLYAGVGLIQEAVDILKSMPEDDDDFSTESLVWANLLSLCRFQASATLGERIAKFLIETEPQNFSHYQLLLNVYAAAGRWDDVVRVKEMVKERRIGRMPGCSLLDLTKIVHEYKVTPHSQEQLHKINKMTGENS